MHGTERGFIASSDAASKFQKRRFYLCLCPPLPFYNFPVRHMQTWDIRYVVFEALTAVVKKSAV
jgi:hypothetical protein